jgi:K+-transporting ATPase KdpF subunit
MIFDYSLAALVTVGLMIYLTYALLRRAEHQGAHHHSAASIGWIQIILYCAIIVAIVPVLGGYMTRVFNGERTLLSPVLRPVEAALYAAGGVDEKREQHWLTYTVAMLLFHRRWISSSTR